MILALLSCAAAERAPPGGGTSAATGGWDLLVTDVALAGGALPHGTVADVAVQDGLIVAVGELQGDATEQVDGTGRWLAPAFIDSHVHLAYLPQGQAMAEGGVAAAVDLAAPTSLLSAEAGSAARGPLHLVASGPMVTAVGGYPTQGWGSGGYGIECADAAQAEAAVDSLVDQGAGLIKLPVTDPPVLDATALAAAVTRAHARGVPVASHALTDAHALAAGVAGADLLAHTPVEALSDATLDLWAGRAVISTLHAFGGAAAQDNLARLRERGAVVLYGTDFGNSTSAGIDAEELALLIEAGLSGAEVLAAGTRDPAAAWGLSDLGSLEVGKAASLLLLEADPHAQPQALAAPAAVWIAGQRP